MAQALTLAERGRYSTAPNPVVGCVIVKDDAVVGEGWHQRAGEPHAEINALAAAGAAARGATLYVTLEPCPMCAGAISFARIRRLYYGADDPKGGGVAHGARVFERSTCHHAPDVYGGLDAARASSLLKDFFRSRRDG